MERRSVLQAIGTVGIAALAGCAQEGENAGDGGTNDGGDGGGGNGGNSSDGGGGGPLTGEEYPAVQGWLTDDEIGGPAPNYDGSIEDARGDEPTVEVGAGEDGLRFDPPAIAVAPGTTVTWEWTGEGGAHNVMADPDEGSEETDFEFSSGDPVEGEDETFEHTFDETGVGLYHCTPHLAAGMKGAVVVEEE